MDKIDFKLGIKKRVENTVNFDMPVKLRKIVLKDYGEYFLAKDIMAKVIEITGKGDLFLTKADNQRRPGSQINAKMFDAFTDKNVKREYGIQDDEIISLPYKGHERIIQKMESLGLVTRHDYKTHGKLDLYSAKVVKMVVRLYAVSVSYEVQEDQIGDVFNLTEFVINPVSWETKQLLSQTTDYEPNPILSPDAEQQKQFDDIEKTLMGIVHAGKRKRRAGGKVIDCLPVVGQYWVRLYFDLCKSTLEHRLQIRDEGLERIKQYLAYIETQNLQIKGGNENE